MDRSKLEEWLEDKPLSWGVAIAARAALRVVPFVRFQEGEKREGADVPLLTAWRAAASTWVYACYPACGEAARVATAAAADAAIGGDDTADAAFRAAGYAADAAADSGYAVGVPAYAARAAAYAARAAANAIAAEGMLWYEVETDMEVLSGSIELSDEIVARLVFLSLWEFQPSNLDKRWNEVKAELLPTVASETVRGMGPHLDETERRRLKELEAEDWGVWTEWYDRRLRGDPPNEALEIERVTSSTIPWGQGPKLVNRALREIERKHLALAARLPERIERDAETGLHRAAPDPARRPRELAVAVLKVRASISDIRAQVRVSNAYGALGPALDRLEGDMALFKSEPLGLHDAFLRTLKVILKKTDAGELPRENERIDALHDDLANGAADIRASDKTVEAVIAGRSRIKLLSATDDQIRDGDLATEAKAAASVPELAEPMREDWGVLRAVRDGAQIDEDEAKAAVQRYISRSTRIDETATRKTLLQKGAEFGDRIAKIDKGSRAAARMFGFFWNLLG